MGRVDGKVAVVTGGGSGLGRATALLFAREGSAVGVADIDSDSAEKIAAEIRARGGRAVAARADVSVTADVERMLQAIVDVLGGLDVLVNNAGVITRTPLEATSDADWARTLAVDLSGVFVCSRAAARHMRARGGAIVNIASVAGMRGGVTPAYTAAKGGVIALTRQLGGELAPQKIRVNAISPGFIATPLNARLRAAGIEARLSQRIPLRRYGTPEDVAAACLFLASDDARYITGTNLVVDGGLSSFLDFDEAYRSFDVQREDRS